MSKVNELMYLVLLKPMVGLFDRTFALVIHQHLMLYMNVLNFENYHLLIQFLPA